MRAQRFSLVTLAFFIGYAVGDEVESPNIVDATESSYLSSSPKIHIVEPILKPHRMEEGRCGKNGTYWTSWTRNGENGYCYYVSHKHFTSYERSNRQCHDMKAELAWIESPEEQKFIESILPIQVGAVRDDITNSTSNPEVAGYWLSYNIRRRLAPGYVPGSNMTMFTWDSSAVVYNNYLPSEEYSKVGARLVRTQLYPCHLHVPLQTGKWQMVHWYVRGSGYICKKKCDL